MAVKAASFKLNARPDTLDFRDLMYVPTLVEVPLRLELAAYKKMGVPILDQGQEGACTGYGLATVANFLLRMRKVDRDETSVSPKMFYALAKRYDEWQGEDYEGSSARGAMKGWHKHGVCEADAWPDGLEKAKGGSEAGTRTAGKSAPAAKKKSERQTWQENALLRPLGAYFRVNHKNLVAMHAAMAEVGILYATSGVHSGWDKVGADGIIPHEEKKLGGHAFAIVAYDENGFWIQNSWGKKWGAGGFARIGYDDWLENGNDVWVARLGVPVKLRDVRSATAELAAGKRISKAASNAELRPHIVSFGNDGLLKEGGDFGTSKDDVAALFQEEFPRLTAHWKKKRLLLYAHGGLVGQDNAVQRVAEYRAALLEAEVYPVAFIWRTDFWSTVKNILSDAFRRRRPEGFLSDAKDFMLDRLDDALEPIARLAGGKAQWDEMKENALKATETEAGGGRWVLEQIARLAATIKGLEIHLVAHSAGSIFQAPMVRLLTAQGTLPAGEYLGGEKGYGLKIASSTLWAPACSTELFKRAYLPALKSGGISRFGLFTLTDKAEQEDHCAHIYNKSLLYLVSNSFEAKPRIPFFRDGTPILGMEKFIRQDKAILNALKGPAAKWVRAPNTAPPPLDSSTACQHGGFDDDDPTVQATLAHILGKTAIRASFAFARSSSSKRSKREKLP